MNHELAAEVVFRLRGETDLIPISYSGRRMYGEHCVAVVCDNPFHIIGVLIETFEDIRSFNDELVINARVDDMGLQKVIYWPHLPWTSDLNEEEET
jgi:hypothetical protein